MSTDTPLNPDELDKPSVDLSTSTFSVVHQALDGSSRDTVPLPDQLNVSFDALIPDRSDIKKALSELHYDKPTHIQALAIPLIISGQNRQNSTHLIGQAKSGTGKTGAFLLSILCCIDTTLKDVQALIVGPTRELVRQIYDVACQLGKYVEGFEALLDVPEAILPPKITQQLIVGTPGRVLNALERKKFNIKNLKIFVLDEADSMLNEVQDSNKQADKIKTLIGNRCQICLFSATFSEVVQQFTEIFVPKPKTSILIRPEDLSVHKLKQTVIFCDDEITKMQILKEIFEVVSVGQSIVFVHTRGFAKKLLDFLKESDFEVSLLTGEMPANLRDEAIDRFRKGEERILISTNVLARGIDVLNVSLVINFDLPLITFKNGVRCIPEPDFETYMHRVGRTARNEKPGLAINFVHNPQTRDHLAAIGDYFHLNIERIQRENFEKIQAELETMTHAYNVKTMKKM